ncbi:recombinase family protein [Pseudalkalibacillus berkeleyi]|uniref:Recombinase family protein n=1 Tax=Pseudalkalibacillus berkeleyi TaxID=1069813 RepID=A0ABS9H0B6_9BACL|nr:recombinase family protein [Pseudalkalibacillus berkeleyi]MCF6137227.1 recombinase family protein [Pseudalkalibacillus berkeleyi]
MAKLGYARVATGNDALEEQVTVLKDYGCDKIFTDDRSSKMNQREGLKALLNYAREGDVVIVIKLDRFARSIQDLQQTTEELRERGIHFISLTQNIDTSKDSDDAVFNWIEIFSEFERELHSERIKLGIENAREKGIKLGRTEADLQMKEKAFEMYHTEEFTMKEIVQETGLSRATIYRYIEKRKGSKEIERQK